MTLPNHATLKKPPIPPYDAFHPVPSAMQIKLLVEKEKMALSNVSREDKFESLDKKTSLGWRR